MQKVIINTDGGARGNPGPAGIGVVFYDESGQELESYKEYIGETTNNQAEYQAVVKALELVPKHNPVEIEVRIDSELVVKQINGEYKVKNPDFQPWIVKIHNFKQTFNNIRFIHVRREQNKRADELVNEALDEYIQG